MRRICVKYVAAVVPRRGAQRREIRQRSVESNPCVVMFVRDFGTGVNFLSAYQVVEYGKPLEAL
jgi:hypothetical protein